IDVSGLHVYYGDFLAVEDVTMTSEPRSVTAFIGSSGCGKSTFLRTLNRMHEVTPGAHAQGKVLLDDLDIYGPDVDPVMVRSEIGMVFQKANPFPTMSIYDNIIAGAKLNNKRMSKSAADDLVEESLIHKMKENYTIVSVTHNVQQAARVSDRTAFFNLSAPGKPGRLIEMGETNQIFTRPEKKETENYITGRFG